MLALTGRLADGWIPSLSHLPPQDVPEAQRQINEASAAAGRKPAEIRRLYNVMGQITDGPTRRLLEGPVSHWVQRKRREGEMLMMKTAARTVPRPFALHWGRGLIVEEATYIGKYHEPSLQLLEYEDGALGIRLCYYDHSGRFQRSPLIVGKRELAGLRRALPKTPRLRALLRTLVA